MKPSRIREAWQRLKQRVVGAVIQDCPVEMCACEACGRLQCTRAEWVRCGKRLATADYLRDGNRDALALLMQIHQREEAARLAPQQAATAGSPPEAETTPSGSATLVPGSVDPGRQPPLKRTGKPAAKVGVAGF